MVTLLVILGFTGAFFFLSLVMIFTSPNDFFEVGDLFELGESMEFSWGHIWVYDSDPENKDNKETLLFLHSMGASIYCWRHQFEYFQKNYRVVALDMLGFGRSDKNISASYDLEAQTDRLYEFMKAKEITQCSLIGCSMGAALGLWMCSQTPLLFKKIVAIAPAAYFRLVPLPHWDLAHLGPLARRIISPRIVRMGLANGLSHPELITPEVLLNYSAPFSDPNGIICFLKAPMALKDPRIYEALSSLQTPVLLLWGAKDRVITRSVMERIYRKTKKAQYEVHPQGGHHLMEDEPEWVNKKIEIFLRLDERKSQASDRKNT